MAGVAIVTWFFMRHIQLSHDIVWQFWVSRQMLGGTRLYAEIWEVNPPLWFWSAMPIQWVATQSGITWQALLIPLLIALSAASAAMTMRMVDLGKPFYNLFLLLIIFWISAVVPLADLGQREHFAFMFSLPYAALIARRTTGKNVSTCIAVIIGILGAFGFALKHYFLIVPIALELWLWLCLRRSWQLWRPELFVLTGLGAVYAACVVWLTPEFFTIALPMIRTAYHGYEATLYDVLFHPWPIFWAMAAVFLSLTYPVIRKNLNPENRAFLAGVTILLACFLFSYFVQHKGPYYHGIPITGALTIAIVVFLTQLQQVRLLPIAFGIALLYLPLSTLIAIQDNSHQFVKLSDKVFSRVPVGEPVFVASANPLFWPTIEQHQLIWPSRVSSLWMLPAIARSELVGPATPELKELVVQLNAAILEDLRCNPPAIILFPSNIPVEYGAQKFPIREFLFRDANLRRFIEENYVLANQPDFAHVYHRQRLPRVETKAGCRPIH